MACNLRTCRTSIAPHHLCCTCSGKSGFCCRRGSSNLSYSFIHFFRKFRIYSVGQAKRPVLETKEDAQGWVKYLVFWDLWRILLIVLVWRSSRNLKGIFEPYFSYWIIYSFCRWFRMLWWDQNPLTSFFLFLLACTDFSWWLSALKFVFLDWFSDTHSQYAYSRTVFFPNYPVFLPSQDSFLSFPF